MSAEFIALARMLPERLTRFFAKYPPGTATGAFRNPFKPTVHAATGKWHNPVFSLRRQSELCKAARAFGVEELLPPTSKSSMAREAARARRAEKGMRVRGHRGERTLKGRYVLAARGGRRRRGRWLTRRLQDRNAQGGHGEDAGHDRGVEAQGPRSRMEGLAQRKGQVLDGKKNGQIKVYNTDNVQLLQYQHPLRRNCISVSECTYNNHLLHHVECAMLHHTTMLCRCVLQGRLLQYHNILDCICFATSTNLWMQKFNFSTGINT